MSTPPIEVPKRSLFRSAEVCELAQLQPYVLRSWESEFPDLGVAKAAGGPRLYRRADVERVLQIKQLVFGEGLTLAGVRRRLGEARPGAEEAALDELLKRDARERLLRVRDGLRGLLQLLSKNGGANEGFALTQPGSAASAPRRAEPSTAARRRGQKPGRRKRAST